MDIPDDVAQMRDVVHVWQLGDKGSEESAVCARPDPTRTALVIRTFFLPLMGRILLSAMAPGLEYVGLVN